MRKPKLAPDLELLRMGLTPPEVELLAFDDPCRLLSSPTSRALLEVALGNGSTVIQFFDKMAKWRKALGTNGNTAWKSLINQ